MFKIKEFRQELGMSQEELADKAHISRTIISGLENGTERATTTKTLIAIAAALGKEVHEIFLP